MTTLGATLSTTSIGALLYDSGILGADTASMDTGAIIPATYINLRIVLSLRADTVDVYDVVKLIINNDTGANYDYIVPYFYHSAAYATLEGLAATSIYCGFSTAASSVASDFAKITIDIPDYANSNINKDILGYSGWRGSASSGVIRLYNTYGHWRSTAAITQIAVAPLTALKKWKQYSRMVVYGY